MKNLNVVFMGTPTFAVPILEALIENTKVSLVVCQPDKEKDKKGNIIIPPIKKVALEHNIPVFQPVRIKEDYQKVLDMQPDIIITCAFGQIIPEILLNYPKYKCINVHASLLPKLRGGAPIHWAIINGEKETGVTIMYMDTHMDSGDIITSEKIKIESDDILDTLYNKLSLLGRDLLMKTLPNIISGNIKRAKQDESKVTLGYNIKKEEEHINFNKNSIDIHNLVRGLNSNPGAYFIMNDARVKVYETNILDKKYEGTIGEIVDINKEGLIVKTKDSSIIIKDIKVEGKKRTKVKARIVAHALEELIKENDKIMIMGHTNPDIDAIGSALGIYRIAKTLEKEAKIVANVETPSIKDLYESIKDQYQEVFISSETALAQVDSGTLIIVVDTHKKTYVESPELLTKTNKIVIIDHHRRSADFIDNSILTFQEVYASSAAELVTEIIQYTQNEVELSEVEAEALYAGIMMDTKNFTFKTGVRTFEAAAYLRRCGVDIIKVKKWFQSDLESYNTISEIVRKAEIVRDSIGISIYDVQEKETSLICAKAADELLTIGNITASFVLGLMEDGKVCISGRSIGDVNVQMILEKLGGGGHITLAGAQLENVTIDEAKQELISKINEYFEEKE